MIKEHKVKGGKIKYRVPNIGELMELLGEMGYSIDDMSKLEEDGPEQMKFSGRLIKHLPPFIEEVKIKTDAGKQLKSIDDLMYSAQYMGDLAQLGMSLMSSLGVDKEKKD